jgi:hypothetical protein
MTTTIVVCAVFFLEAAFSYATRNEGVASFCNVNMALFFLTLAFVMGGIVL